jgi:hypothetical protein
VIQPLARLLVKRAPSEGDFVRVHLADGRIDPFLIAWLGQHQPERAPVSRVTAMTLDGERIRHTVAFRLVHAEGSDEARGFLETAASLAALPGVEAFELMREVSPKNPYRYGISMEFADQAAYDGYNEHPEHVRFVNERWLVEVADFLEIDYAPYLSGT